MSESKEGFFAKLSGIGQVISVVLAALGIAIPWYIAHRPAQIAVIPSPVVVPSRQVQHPLPPPAPPLFREPSVATEPPAKEGKSRSLPSRRDQPVLPLDLTLRDGEQRTFLGDQASVAAEFNRIGSEDFVTLRVGTTEGEAVPHAVVGAGARFPIVVAGSSYSVYILNVDKLARTVGVRISRNSEVQARGQ